MMAKSGVGNLSGLVIHVGAENFIHVISNPHHVAHKTTDLLQQPDNSYYVAEIKRQERIS